MSIKNRLLPVILGAAAIIGNQMVAMQAQSETVQKLITVLERNNRSSQEILSYLSFSDISHLQKTCKGLLCVWDPSRKIKIKDLIELRKIRSKRVNFPHEKLWQITRFLNARNASSPIRLDLRGYKYQIDQLLECPYVRSLSLANWILKTLPEAIRVKFYSITKLDARSTTLTDESFGKICEWFPGLENLNISMNYCLHSLPAQLRLLKNLKKLNLSSNHLTSEALAPLFEWCPQIEQLNISSNHELTILPATIQRAWGLRELSVTLNETNNASLPVQLAQWCPWLKELKVKSAGQPLSAALVRLNHLEVLDLREYSMLFEDVYSWIDAIHIYLKAAHLNKDVPPLKQLRLLKFGRRNFSKEQQEQITQMAHLIAPHATILFMKA